MEIDKIVKAVRHKVHMSLDEIALSSGYSKSTLSMIENGKRNTSIITLSDILNSMGYELKVVKKNMFTQDIVEWSSDLPEMVEDAEADEETIREWGRPVKSKKDYLLADSDGNIVCSRLYRFPDNVLEDDGNVGIHPRVWMEKPHFIERRT